MKITNLKINGITNPVGFAYDQILCSWKVVETTAKKQVNTVIEMSKSADFSEVIAKVSGVLASNETEVEMTVEPYTTYYWRVTVEGDNGETAVSDYATFETGKMNEAWSAKWVGPSKEDTYHPVLVKNFETDKKVSRARLYVCGVGVYEAYVNEEKAGNDLLAPFINDYKSCLQYQTYDVTAQIKETNSIEIYLGKGWYMGRFGLASQSENFGSRMGAIAELRMEYEDGTVETVVTDETWQYKGSDIEESGIYFGEIYNHLLWKDKENPLKPVDILAIDTPLVERYSLPVVVKEEITPIEIIHTPAGETVVDMGQNHAGIMTFEADFEAGTTIQIECGEVLQQGNFYHENYERAETIFTYVSDGRKETVRPHFSYYGYRYLKVTGWPGELKKEDIKALVVYSDMETIGHIETSNAKINRLYQNCVWSQKSNFLDMPTDCPQRGERLGWTGDAQVFTPTASYNMDTRAFLRKYMRDLRYDQLRNNGGIANFIPNLEAFGGACNIWGDVATFMPYNIYEKFGNLKDISVNYPMMKDWVDYMHREATNAGNEYLFRPGFQFGDWVALDGITTSSFKGATEDDYLGAVYYYRSTVILSEMAGLLGKEDDQAYYKELSEKIKEAALDEYVSPNGRLSVDTQAAYIVALKFGLYRNVDAIKKQLLNRFKRDCFEIKCGFAGAPLLCITLAEYGMTDIAYDFLFKEGFPSWLYCVNLGATTIWERWNSLLEDGTCNPTGMNSFNHYSYGSVVEFMYAYIGGIRAAVPGFKKAILAPEPNMKLRYFNSSYDSAWGKYVSNWSIAQDGLVTVHFEVPFDCEAKATFPRFNKDGITSICGLSADEIDADGNAVLTAGTYEVTYMPTQDYRVVYTMKTRLGALVGDMEAAEILKETLPTAFGMLMGQDKESMNLTFEEMQFMFFAGMNPEMVANAMAKLAVLKRW